MLREVLPEAKNFPPNDCKEIFRLAKKLMDMLAKDQTVLGQETPSFSALDEQKPTSKEAQFLAKRIYEIHSRITSRLTPA